MALGRALPPGLRVLSVRGRPGEEPVYRLEMCLPEGVVDLLSEVLELAGRLSGSERLGGLLAVMCMECVSSWLPAETARKREA